mgnify:CR=1 FL=1
MAVLAQLVDDVVTNTFELNGGCLNLGRHPSNDIQINEISVSGEHAKIVIETNQYLDGVLDCYIEDKESTNGTFVNDLPVKTRQRLNNNDIVRIAWNSFKFIDETENELEKTAYLLE